VLIAGGAGQAAVLRVADTQQLLWTLVVLKVVVQSSRKKLKILLSSIVRSLKEESFFVV
jgi:hypothetical protein